jgi:hypothetical protein
MPRPYLRCTDDSRLVIEGTGCLILRQGLPGASTFEAGGRLNAWRPSETSLPIWSRWNLLTSIFWPSQHRLEVSAAQH